MEIKTHMEKSEISCCFRLILICHPVGNASSLHFADVTKIITSSEFWGFFCGGSGDNKLRRVNAPPSSKLLLLGL